MEDLKSQGDSAVIIKKNKYRNLRVVCAPYGDTGCQYPGNRFVNLVMTLPVLKRLLQLRNVAMLYCIFLQSPWMRIVSARDGNGGYAATTKGRRSTTIAPPLSPFSFCPPAARKRTRTHEESFRIPSSCFQTAHAIVCVSAEPSVDASHTVLTNCTQRSVSSNHRPTSITVVVVVIVQRCSKRHSIYHSRRKHKYVDPKPQRVW
jgi:hypothetical protein